MTILKNIKRILKRIFLLFVLLFYEKTDGNITYVFKRKKSSDYLLVFFSAFGKKAVYNYISSTRFIKSNKLWIKDNAGFKKAGTYYLGENYPNNDYLNKVLRIITKYGHNKKIICCGTSKGGTCALYYGLLLKAHGIIVGSPQYLIGSYLTENDFYKCVRKAISSDENAEEILDSLIKNELFSSKELPRIRLLYSSHELHYRDQLIPLIDDLRKTCKDLVLEEGPYTVHHDVGKYFPSFLKKMSDDFQRGQIN